MRLARLIPYNFHHLTPHLTVGLVVNGSMGESHHLTREERRTLVSVARQVLDDNGLTGQIQLVAGTGGNSTRDTIALCKDAAEVGADSAMVIAPGELGRGVAHHSETVTETTFAPPQATLPVLCLPRRSRRSLSKSLPLRLFPWVSSSPQVS